MAKWFEAHGKWPNCDEHPFEDRLIDAWDRLGAIVIEYI